MSNSRSSFAPRLSLSGSVNSALSNLPSVVEEFSIADILSQKKDKLKALLPDIANDLVDSDPAIALLEVASYSESWFRNKLNQSILAVSVDYATGEDLNNLGAFYNLTRKVIQQADPNANPPLPEILESDEDFRIRIKDASGGLSVAGPRSSYISFAKKADVDVKDITAESPSAGEVVVTVLSYSNGGIASDELIAKVTKALNDENVRPLGDRLSVQKAEIIKYKIEAEVTLKEGENIDLEEIKKQVQSFVDGEFKLAIEVPLSAIYASFHQISSVLSVDLKSPSGSVVTSKSQAPFCEEIKITRKEQENEKITG